MTMWVAIAYLIVNAAFAASVPLLRRRLHPVEIAAIYLFSTIMLQQYVLVTDYNLKWKVAVNNPWIFVTHKTNQFVFFPVMIAWHFFFLRIPRITIAFKALITLTALVLVLFFVEVQHWAGFYEYKQWNLFRTLLAFAFIFISTGLFVWVYRRWIVPEGEPA